MIFTHTPIGVLHTVALTRMAKRKEIEDHQAKEHELEESSSEESSSDDVRNNYLRSHGYHSF